MAKHERTTYRILCRYIDMADKLHGSAIWKPSWCEPLSIERLYLKDWFGDWQYRMIQYDRWGLPYPGMRFAVNREKKTVRPLEYWTGYGDEKIIFKSRIMFDKRYLTELDDYLWRWAKKIAMTYIRTNADHFNGL